MPRALFGSKSRATKANIEDFLLKNSCTRDTCLVAVGGGVVGDLVGYVAATFMRGIPFVQVPTTLLAMVDSSLGGKTAIDTPAGKNLVGAFWQPKRVYMDLGMLMTLPSREFRNGMAEVIKTAAISSEADFKVLEDGATDMEASLHTTQEASKGREKLLEVILASARFKADVVTEDEREGGLRGLLNFGHTIGHAFEKILSPDWLHGECVSVGLVAEAEVSHLLGHCDYAVVERLKRVLVAYGLPIDFDAATKARLGLDDVMQVMRVDKKNQGSQKKLVILSSIGTTLEPKASAVADDAIENIVKKYVSEHSVVGSLSVNSSVHSSVVPVVLVVSTEEESAWVKKAVSPSVSFVTVSRTKENQDKKAIVIRLTSVPTSSSTGEYEYCYITLDNAEAAALIGFIGNLVEPAHVKATHPTSTRFVTPTVDSYDSVNPFLMSQWLEDVHAIEFRVDLLTATNWVTTAGIQLAHLRRSKALSGNARLPIIFTVRTVPQAGKFDPADLQTHADLVKWAHFWGCDYIDLEITTLSKEVLQNLLTFNHNLTGTHTIIGSYHDPSHKHGWTSSTEFGDLFKSTISLFQEHDHKGIVKLVGAALTLQDSIDLEVFRSRYPSKALIAINMGPHGKISRVLNRFLSPVTHECLPAIAAPGQLTASEIIQLRQGLGLD
ncbi:3-dehydroquinate synthase-domain-containing protein [Phycomyces blakesleeanus]